MVWFPMLDQWLRRFRVDDADLKRELETHIALETESLEEEGLDPQEARYRAMRELGNTVGIRETAYELGFVSRLDRCVRDLRVAARALWRNAAFTAAAVLSLALGIGTNIAIFTVADQILLRPLGVADPDRLVALGWEGRFVGGLDAGGNRVFSYPAYEELAGTDVDGLTGIAARYQQPVAIETDSGAERVDVEFVSGNYFEVIGTGASIGRTLMPEDDNEWGAEPYVVLSYRYWETHFGRDPAVLGETVRIDNVPVRIVGVATEHFTGFDMLNPADLFMPLKMEPAITGFNVWERRDAIWLTGVARLDPGAEIDLVEGALALPYLEVLRMDLEGHPRDEEFSQTYLQNRITLSPAAGGSNTGRALIRRPLYVLGGLVAILFLIACLNVANLIVARSTQRQQEISIRSSLGAPRGAIVGFVMAESVVLAVVGGILGLLFSGWTMGLLLMLLPPSSVGLVVHATPDIRILAFTAALTLVAAFLAGLGPAIRISAPGRSLLLLGRITPRASAGRDSARVRRLLVASQIALCLALLVGAGMFVESLRNLFSVDPGIATERLVEFSVDTSHRRRTWDDRLRSALEIQDRLLRVPGITGATASVRGVLEGDILQNSMRVESYEPVEGERTQAGWNVVLPGFFSTFGIPFLAGRDFSTGDTAERPYVMVVTESFANHYFGSPEAALDRRTGWGTDGPLDTRIIGVVSDFKSVDLKDDDLSERTISSVLQGRLTTTGFRFYVSTDGEARTYFEPVRRIVAELEPSAVVSQPQTLSRQVEITHYRDILLARLSTAFAILASLLTAVGLSGLMAFSVARRTTEIGIRIAFGAAPRDIIRLVLGEVSFLLLVGLGIGATLGLGVFRVIESQLFEAQSLDPRVVLIGMLLLVLVTVAAGIAPARRAVRVQPQIALDNE